MHGKPTQDKSGESLANLKKLYSSHVLENTTLQRRKTDLESAKVKKIRELNHDELVFLRKYDKYTVGGVTAASPSPYRRRGSIDVRLARALEYNYNERRPSTSVGNREENLARSKSFLRDNINSECPYSLETWHKLVDSETSLIDQYKKDILKATSKPEFPKSNSADDLNMGRKTASSENIILDQSRVPKKRTLKPLQKDIELNRLDDEDAIDAEIVAIQNTRRKSGARGRRHSLGGPLVHRVMSLDAGVRLPSIGSSDGSVQQSDHMDSKKCSSEEQLTSAVSREDLRPLKVPSNRRNTINTVAADVPSITVQAPVVSETLNSEANSPMNSTDNCNACTSILSKEATRRENPRPTANAAIVINTDDAKVGPMRRASTMFDVSLLDNNNNTNTARTYDNGNDATTEEQEGDPDRGTFLPNISPRSTGGQSDNKSPSGKRVTFLEEPAVPRPRAGSNPPSVESPVKYSNPFRRNSLTTATLKLLVDSHHGAAKLRYIALLATEMEKEAKGDKPDSPEPDPYQQLDNCRYLRVQTRREDTIGAL